MTLTEQYHAYLKRVEATAEELHQLVHLCKMIKDQPEMLTHAPKEWVALLRCAELSLARLIECSPWAKD